jgi:DNA polymerase III alpha subunit (gram-positive type)
MQKGEIMRGSRQSISVLAALCAVSSVTVLGCVKIKEEYAASNNEQLNRIQRLLIRQEEFNKSYQNYLNQKEKNQAAISAAQRLAEMFAYSQAAADESLAYKSFKEQQESMKKARNNSANAAGGVSVEAPSLYSSYTPRLEAFKSLRYPSQLVQVMGIMERYGDDAAKELAELWKQADQRYSFSSQSILSSSDGERNAVLKYPDIFPSLEANDAQHLIRTIKEYKHVPLIGHDWQDKGW